MVGQSLTFNCSVGGGPVDSLEWLHNGRLISGLSNGGSGVRVRLISRDVLHFSKVSHTDKGMYQCVASNEYDSSHAQVQLEVAQENHNDDDGIRFERLISEPAAFARPERDSGQ